MRKILFIDGYELVYELTYKKIKNINLRVHPDGSVSVSAPRGISVKAVEDFMRSVSTRLMNAIEKANAALSAKAEVPADIVYILGKMYRITVLRSGKDFPSGKVERSDSDKVLRVYADQDYLYSDEAVGKYAEAYLRDLCISVVNDVTRYVYPYFASKGVGYPQITFRKMKSRWGSCLPETGKVTFNTALVHFPVECIELVAAHEFTHFLHPDHSAAFYDELGKCLPDWKERKKKLEELARIVCK